MVDGDMAPHIRNLGTIIRFAPSGRLMSRRSAHVPTGYQVGYRTTLDIFGRR